jgi:hypothetical protein
MATFISTAVKTSNLINKYYVPNNGTEKFKTETKLKELAY